VLALTELGPGTPSLDEALGIERSGPRWALAALAAGVTGAVGAHLAAEAHAPTPTPPEAAPEAAAETAVDAAVDSGAVAETQPA
jgi:putative oxidoreductase